MKPTQFIGSRTKKNWVMFELPDNKSKLLSRLRKGKIYFITKYNIFSLLQGINTHTPKPTQSIGSRRNAVHIKIEKKYIITLTTYTIIIHHGS